MVAFKADATHDVKGKSLFIMIMCAVFINVYQTFIESMVCSSFKGGWGVQIYNNKLVKIPLLAS
jgi:hypothetical protein